MLVVRYQSDTVKNMQKASCMMHTHLINGPRHLLDNSILEQNLIKNVSKGQAFLWQAQIQPIEYYLKCNDTIRI